MIVDIHMKSPLKVKIVDLKKNYHMDGKLHMLFSLSNMAMEYMDTAIAPDSYLHSNLTRTTPC